MGVGILTRLNPKGSDIGRVGYSTAGGLTSADISAACAGANAVGETILLAKICGDRCVQDPLFYKMYTEVIDLATKQGWKAKKRGEDKIRSVLQLAIYESVTQYVCPVCRGTKWSRKDPTKPCTPCRGTGKWRISDTDKAAVTGISKTAWSKLWRYRYEDIVLMLENYEHQAKVSILNKLR